VARLIKSGARVVPAVIVDASKRAEAIVRSAHEEAERTRAAIRDEASVAARHEARAEVARALIAIEAARAQAIEEIRGEVVALSIAVARQILGETLEAQPDRVRALTDVALARVARSHAVRVRVHPEDVGHLFGIIAEVVADSSLSRGDCVVESDLGDIDGRIETQLEHLARALEPKP